MNEQRLPLEGVKVLDFTHALAGPYCTSSLALWGAEVIKVEGMHGEATRTVCTNPKFVDPVQGSDNWIGMNSNKLDLCINTRDPKGIEILKGMLPEMDVVVSNFRPGTMEKMGLSYDVIKEINPKIIYGEISAFGDGPDKNLPGMDIVVQAKAGTIASTGEPGHMAKPSPSLSDMNGGIQMLIGILMALYNRTITGKGQKINVSMLDSTMLLFQQYIQGLADFPPYDIKPTGMIHHDIVPCQPYETAQGLIYISVGTSKLWKLLCEALGVAEYAEDPRFQEPEGRVENREAINEILVPVFKTKTAEEWTKILGTVGVPNAMIQSPKQAVQNAIRYGNPSIMEVEHPKYGKMHTTGTSILMSDTPAYNRSAAPRLGEHTQSLLHKYLGMSEKEVAELEEQGVLKQYREE